MLIFDFCVGSFNLVFAIKKASIYAGFSVPNIYGDVYIKKRHIAIQAICLFLCPARQIVINY